MKRPPFLHCILLSQIVLEYIPEGLPKTVSHREFLKQNTTAADRGPLLQGPSAWTGWTGPSPRPSVSGWAIAERTWSCRTWRPRWWVRTPPPHGDGLRDMGGWEESQDPLRMSHSSVMCSTTVLGCGCSCMVLCSLHKVILLTSTNTYSNTLWTFGVLLTTTACPEPVVPCLIVLAQRLVQVDGGRDDSSDWPKGP